MGTTHVTVTIRNPANPEKQVASDLYIEVLE